MLSFHAELILEKGASAQFRHMQNVSKSNIIFRFKDDIDVSGYMGNGTGYQVDSISPTHAMFKLKPRRHTTYKYVKVPLDLLAAV